MHVRSARLFVVALLIVAASLATSAAVRPPKLQYDISTLPNGLTLVLSEDHDAHRPSAGLVSRRFEERKERPHRVCPLEHLMFKGSKNVGPEEHTSMMTSLGGRAMPTPPTMRPSSGNASGAVSADDVLKPIAWRHFGSTGNLSE
jgi:hypothetical protein